MEVQQDFWISQNLLSTFQLKKSDINNVEEIEFTDKNKDEIVKRIMLGGIMKIKIPFENRAHLLLQLKSMNISYATLFPDIEGLDRPLTSILDGVSCSQPSIIE